MEKSEVIDVSAEHLVLGMMPLIGIAGLSWLLELDVEKNILSGTFRSFFQLSILSLILDPIFSLGLERWWLVVGYTFLMVLLAAFESSSRCKYYFHGMLWYVLTTMLAVVSAVAAFAFFVIIRPDPVWNPQYVIPISGMLLGNCITGVSLALDSLLISMVENSREVELLLSFGANRFEATGRLLRESVRTGSMPQITGMAIIGIISIPGMMTGQILGGSNVREAARYQILILYLICTCTFCTILTQVYLAVHICFDKNTVLRTDRLHKRGVKRSLFQSFLRPCYESCRSLFAHIRDYDLLKGRQRRRSSASYMGGVVAEATYLAPKGELSVESASPRSDNQRTQPILSVSGLTYSFEKGDSGICDEVAYAKPVDEMDEETETLLDTNQRRVLFRKVSMQVFRGRKALVNGPSGVGKSTLLRILAGLTDADEGKISLEGMSQSTFRHDRTMTSWRKQVLYVPQTKVDIPGSPMDLLKRVASFKVWKQHRDNSTSNNNAAACPSYSDMKSASRELVQTWGTNPALLESEWKILSGGESQRMLLALALVSRPKVILLDESTSALDEDSKLRIEKSVDDYCERYGMCAIWITHDQGQKSRVNMDHSNSSLS